MMKELSVLTNVFVNSRENELLLADIYFKEKIRRIVPVWDKSIRWKDIAGRDQWENFRRKVKSRELPERATVYEGNFRLLIPGAIDAHVHFNTPGFEDREDFEHGSLAAAHGGVTTVIDMPCTSLPPVTSVPNLRRKLTALEGRSWIDFALWGGVAGNDLESGADVQRQILELAQAGVVGFKAYLISGMDTFRDLTAEQMQQVAQWIKPTGKLLAVHAEDRELVVTRRQALQREGRTDWQAYCTARDVLAEERAVQTMVNIARQSGCPVHIVHLSSAPGLRKVSDARKEGLQFSAETCPHYLFFTRDDFDNPAISAYLKTAPPVKSGKDREALWMGLADGSLSFVTTDHAGCDPEKEKSSTNFWEVYGGIPGVEHRVPFLFSEGFLKGRLSLQRTIDLLCGNPAQFFGLSAKGSLEVGKDADLVLMNLWDQQMITAEKMHSKGRYTPFEGVLLHAVVEETFVRGKRVMGKDGESEVEVGYGKWIAV